MSVRMFDCSYTQPNPQQAQAFYAQGFRVAAGYLNTAGAAAPWSSQAWLSCAGAGLHLIGIAFPYSDPNNVVAQCRAHGIPIAVLDVEANRTGDAGMLNHARTWGASVHNLGVSSAIYSTQSFALNVMASFDGVWYPNQNVPVSPKVAVQWGFDKSYAGINYDESNAGDWFAGGSVPVGHIAGPYVSIEETPSGKGYWVMAANGGVETHGDAQFYGSAVQTTRPDGTVVGIIAPDTAVSFSRTETGAGYTILSKNGGVFCFGDASFEGSEVG